MFNNNKYLELIKLTTEREQNEIITKLEITCANLAALTSRHTYSYEDIYLYANKFTQLMNSYFETKKQIENLEKDLKQNDKHTTKK